MRKICLIAVVLGVIGFPSGVSAQIEHSLVGTWKLVSVSSWTEKGDVNKAAHGSNPSGFLTYTPDGRMMVIIAEDERKPLSVADRVSAPTEEKARAFSTFIAYAGRYNFTGDKVVHHVEVASLPNDVGADLVRSVTLQGDRLTLRTPPMLRGGVLQTFELAWERLRK